jgi:Ras-related GTP-binding protein C/D
VVDFPGNYSIKND